MQKKSIVEPSELSTYYLLFINHLISCCSFFLRSVQSKYGPSEKPSDRGLSCTYRASMRNFSIRLQMETIFSIVVL